jgi:hypothetical protein
MPKDAARWRKKVTVRNRCKLPGPHRSQSGFAYIVTAYIMRDAYMQEEKGPDHCLSRIPWRTQSRLAVTIRRRLFFRKLSVIGEAHELEGDTKITE